MAQLPLFAIVDTRVPVVVIRAGLQRYMRLERQLLGLCDFYHRAGGFFNKVVEVGCYWGESTEVAAHFTRRLWCVDPWTSGKDERRFDRRIERFEHVRKIKATSHEAVKRFPNNTLDLVYIDAQHNYENVKRDILSWFPKVRTKGWISGHDYDDRPSHVGVVRAVDEILGPPELTFSDTSFLFRKTPDLIERVRNLYPEAYAESADEQN